MNGCFFEINPIIHFIVQATLMWKPCHAMYTHALINFGNNKKKYIFKKPDEMEEYVLLKICYNKIIHICHISYNPKNIEMYELLEWGYHNFRTVNFDKFSLILKFIKCNISEELL